MTGATVRRTSSRKCGGFRSAINLVLFAVKVSTPTAHIFEEFTESKIGYRIVGLQGFPTLADFGVKCFGNRLVFKT